MSHVQKKFIASLKAFYLVCVPTFKSINSSSLSRKKYDGDNFTSTPLSDHKIKILRWE